MEKVILITGGSQGIGASTAILAARKNYSVCINYHKNDSAANDIVKKIHVEGGKAFVFKADISKEDEVLNLFENIDNRVGKISVLINNAGIIESQKLFVDMNAARLQNVFGTNVIGSFLCAREAIKGMSTKRGGNGGAIVN